MSSDRSFSNGNGTSANGAAAGAAIGVIGQVGPAFQGQPWADGHWWHLS